MSKGHGYRGLVIFREGREIGMDGRDIRLGEGGGNIQKLIFISPMIFFGLYYAIPILPPTKPRLINKMIKNVVCYDIAQKRLVNLYK